jgi:hypothetical protein
MSWKRGRIHEACAKYTSGTDLHDVRKRGEPWLVEPKVGTDHRRERDGNRLQPTVHLTHYLHRAISDLNLRCERCLRPVEEACAGGNEGGG